MHRILVILLGLALLPIPALAQTQLSRVVVGSGGGTAQSPQTRVWLTVGQSAVGPTAATTQAGVGFWTLVQDMVTAVDGPPGPVFEFGLDQNRPNPFNPATTIRFRLAEAGPASLVVYDLRGRAVATLVDTDLAAGSHELRFHATELSSGVYFYRLRANGQEQVRRMTLVK